MGKEFLTDIRETFTKEQKDFLLSLADECKLLGASTKQLAPFYALIFLKWPQPLLSDEEITRGLEIAKILGLDKESTE